MSSTESPVLSSIRSCDNVSSGDTAAATLGAPGADGVGGGALVARTGSVVASPTATGPGPIGTGLAGVVGNVASRRSGASFTRATSAARAASTSCGWGASP
jgi:hypothetical protein